jgi:hypothetical protein
MKPFKEWAEEYGIVVDGIGDGPIMSDIPISESEFTGKVTIKRMRIIDRDRFDAALLRRGAK